MATRTEAQGILIPAVTGTPGRIVIAVLGIAAVGALGLATQGTPRDAILASVVAFLLVAAVVALVLSVAWKAARRLAGIARVALAASVPWVPGLAAVGTLVIYYALAGEAFVAGWPNVDPAWAIPVGSALALVGWVALAVLSAGSLTGRGANERAFGEVSARARTLRARFNAAEGGSPATHAEIDRHLDWLEQHLANEAPDPRWASGVAYLDAWVALHRAEEALLEFASPADLEAEILHDELRVMSSRLGQESAMLATRLAEAAKATGLRGDRRSAPDPAEFAHACSIAREVRHAVNEFRHARWDGLVRARNRLTKSTQMTSWTTYLLLAIAIVLDAPPEAIGAGVVFYLVGAVVGLFARLRADARLDEAIEDYGLAVARLRQTVVASGLAAVAGVVLVGISAGAGLTTGGDGPVAMVDIFSVSTPGGLLVAAVFGLAPNLLLERLRSKSDEYRRELGDTAAVNGLESDTGSPPLGNVAASVD